MNRLLSVVVALLLFPALTLNPGHVLARGHLQTIKGIVVGMDADTLRVQTQMGSVVVNVGSPCRVINLVTGSETDLKPHRWVTLHLEKGTTIVDAIRVDLTRKGPGPGVYLDGLMPTGEEAAPHALDHAAKGLHRFRSNVSGQIAAVTANSISVVGPPHRDPTVYYLAPNVGVTLAIKGHVSDLFIGETVQVDFRQPSQNAVVVTIVAL